MTTCAPTASEYRSSIFYAGHQPEHLRGCYWVAELLTFEYTYLFMTNDQSTSQDAKARVTWKQLSIFYVVGGRNELKPIRISRV